MTRVSTFMMRTWLGFCATLVPAMLVGCAAPEQPAPREPNRLKLIRQGDTAYLSGIDPIRGFANGRDSTFTHCLELVLKALGRPISYDELMGLSGLAFRTQFRAHRWDVGNSDPLVGENCVAPMCSSVGVDFVVRVVRQDELTEAADLRQAITQSIDNRRMPVLAANIIPPEDWGIITGHGPGRTWLCRSYNGGALGRNVQANGWPTAVVLLRKLKPRPAAKEQYLASLRRAIDFFDQRRAGDYAQGTKAFEYWCTALLHVRDRDYIHANAWTYIGLMDARAAAVRYLRSIAPGFGERGKYITDAADLYEREVRLLQDNYRFVPSESKFPDTIPPRSDRQAQADALHKAVGLETQAIDLLRKAIAPLGEGRSDRPPQRPLHTNRSR